MNPVLLSDFPTWFPVSIFLIIGACVGSFLNVVIWRLPRGMSLSHPPSTCPHCGKRIFPWDNVPILGWLALRGKGRCCKQPISIRYPLVELSGLFLAWLVWDLLLSPHAGQITIGEALVEFTLYFGLCSALLAMAMIDVDFMIIPEEISYSFTLIGLIWAWFRPDLTFQDALVGSIIGFVLVWFPFTWLYAKWRGTPGMGVGDAHLMMLAGAFFGWKGVVFSFFGGAVLGTFLTGPVYLVLKWKGVRWEPEGVTQWRKDVLEEIEKAEGDERADLERDFKEDPLHLPPSERDTSAPLPFGPFLCLAMTLYLFFQESISTLFYAWMTGEV